MKFSPSALLAALAALVVTLAGPEFKAILPAHLSLVLGLIAVALQSLAPALHDAESRFHSGSKVPALIGLVTALVGLATGPAFAALLPATLAGALGLVGLALQAVTGSILGAPKTLNGYVPGAPVLDDVSAAAPTAPLGPPASSYRGSGTI